MQSYIYHYLRSSTQCDHFWNAPRVVALTRFDCTVWIETDLDLEGFHSNGNLEKLSGKLWNFCFWNNMSSAERMVYKKFSIITDACFGHKRSLTNIMLFDKILLHLWISPLCGEQAPNPQYQKNTFYMGLCRRGGGGEMSKRVYCVFKYFDITIFILFWIIFFNCIVFA